MQSVGTSVAIQDVVAAAALKPVGGPVADDGVIRAAGDDVLYADELDRSRTAGRVVERTGTQVDHRRREARVRRVERVDAGTAIDEIAGPAGPTVENPELIVPGVAIHLIQDSAAVDRVVISEESQEGKEWGGTVGPRWWRQNI